jgi:superfamily II DNA or RNA helicase
MDSAPVPVSSSSFPECLQFQKTWRLYQTRILDQLSEYLSDRRVDLVAAPGSGKTILGLEIIRRVGAPTLVLVPTITIRDQWVDRLGCFLCDQQPVLNWVSVDLKHPALLTITTYQALHALCGVANPETDGAEEEKEATTETADSEGEDGNRTVARQFPEVLSRAAFRTLVVDEAHHLHSTWWKTLTFAVDHLDRPTIVSLTATPPYDVTAFEWQRYEELCGPVDAEVSVPELVREGDLCPHQDYVYLSLPKPEELKMISEFRQGVESFVVRLLANKGFVGAVASHPWIVAPDANITALLEDPEYLSSMVIFLNAAGVNVPHHVLNAMASREREFPDSNSNG